MLEIIPVIDLMNSVAVSGKSGNRSEYTPLETIYASSANPVEIASSLSHNINEINDVNRILPVIADIGVDNLNTFEFALKYAYKIIVATETLESIDELRKIFEKYPKERIIVSVDVKNNELLAKHMDIDLEGFKEVLHEIDPDEIILLDISSVGTEGGFNKELLQIFSDFKDKIILGGGITPDEIDEISNMRIKKALVGTALHKGEIRINEF